MPGMGWQPDLPDQRDHVYSAPAELMGALPARVDLRSLCPPAFDQGGLDSCTSNAIAGAFAYTLAKQRSRSRFTPSRLFIYFNERKLDGKEKFDAGARLRDGIKVVSKQGAPPEGEWPYDEERFADEPPKRVYERAARQRVVGYERLGQTLAQLKGCLAAGHPFLFGMAVYSSFGHKRTGETGTLPFPRSSERLLGGHAVLAVGYDDRKERFIVRNSWGTAWGVRGYFTAPYAFLTENDLCRDFWTIREIGAPPA